VNTLALWRTWYTSAGIATIPLVPWGKGPLCEAWQYVPPEIQWSDVGGDDFRGNIGARCGGGLAVIDGDSPEAARNLRAVLAGLGVAASEVATATPGHAQLYLPVVGVPPVFNWCKLPGDVGAGELRAGAGAYVVAPCSKVGDRRYRFVAGDLDTYRALRPVRWSDLALLWGGWQTPAAGPLIGAPIRLVRRAVPARASYLLELLRGAPKGVPLGGYPTRSEAEAAAVAVLVLGGYELPDIERIFGHHLPGHYAEYRTTRQRARYLARTYVNVLGVLAASPVRQELAEVYHAAASWSWPGRGGGLDCKTYRAVISVGWQFDTWSPSASLRVLAEHAGASVNGVKNALGRLAKSDLVRWGGQQDVTRGTTWHIVNKASEKRPYLHSSHILTASSRQQAGSPLLAELWARDRLGASGRLVYGHLVIDGGGATAGELAVATGKGIRTVRRALKKLAAVGLAESDASHPARWHRGDRDLEDVASELGCAAAAARRRARHQDERERWLDRIG
jgi:DNA-binding transcriptional ArsR family regulator